ncbi:hypothetical protein HU762_03605 [Pseudomonas sp. SWRI92]|uniref:hypothetical protein n=1 Tax=Pseudomonas sp. SWRI92 TaxID=2745499 RepID=UPI0016464D8B|nr:hypothetical protein [Pseudomonas sp. SWRI92]MBC3373019.1 hypothetical protein [Pseudomonas sp. SWRI92]
MAVFMPSLKARNIPSIRDADELRKKPHTYAKSRFSKPAQIILNPGVTNKGFAP